MPYSDQSFEDLLPPYLNTADKGRLTASLKQFFGQDEAGFREAYDRFYSQRPLAHLAQSDILHSIKTIEWDSEQKDYYSGYSPALLISNSCDITVDNIRTANRKQALFAPLIPVSECINDLREDGRTEDQINSFYSTLTRQNYTNLIYLPVNHLNGNEYVVFLDKIFWYPTEELVPIVNNLEDQRFVSLSLFGYYIFLTKLSFHLCRVPEEQERD